MNISNVRQLAPWTIRPTTFEVSEVKQIKLFKFFLQPQPFFQNASNQKIHKQLDLLHFKCCGWTTKWSRSCVYAIVTIEGYKRKSWSRNVQTFFFIQEIVTL